MTVLATQTCHISKPVINLSCIKTAGQRLGKEGNDRYDRYDSFPHIAGYRAIAPIYYIKNATHRGTSKNVSYLSCVMEVQSNFGYPMTAKTKPMAPWLAERIAEMITRDGELARPGVCKKCSSGIWVTSIPYPLKLDPEPLNAQGELEALLAGRYTWIAKPFLLTFWPDLRRADDIKNSKLGEIVLADHRCRELIVVDMPDYWPERRSNRVFESNGVCPF